MKLIFLALLICVACSTGPRTPVICQQNLQYCLSVQKDHTSYSATEWKHLCMDDLRECKSNWGIQ